MNLFVLVQLEYTLYEKYKYNYLEWSVLFDKTGRKGAGGEGGAGASRNGRNLKKYLIQNIKIISLYTRNLLNEHFIKLQLHNKPL